jgi:aryl-alcohol dehydrogenase-like predicted oxidoreductase
MTHNFKRTLGKSGIEVSAIGMGCWAIGGPFTGFGKMPLGWGEVDDKESSMALQKAYDKGINFFDTADVYGAGHSERLIGKVFRDLRDKIVIATKFGMVFNEEKRDAVSFDAGPMYVRKAVEDSLNRLNTDYIDLYQLHIKDYDTEKALETRDTLEDLVKEGKIRGYGWSTDDYERALIFSRGDNCIAIQQQLNIFVGNEKILKLCEENDLASVNRGPLGMGLLTGKFKENVKLPPNDVRMIVDSMQDPYYMYFKEGKPLPELLKKLEFIGEILRSGGRTLAQGALAWIWGKSDITIPIPGFKTSKQVADNVKALDFGPLTKGQMVEIEEIMHSKGEVAGI